MDDPLLGWLLVMLIAVGACLVLCTLDTVVQEIRREWYWYRRERRRHQEMFRGDE
jgi:hypothetical protein